MASGSNSADRRRVNGPEGSLPPVYASTSELSARRRILLKQQQQQQQQQRQSSPSSKITESNQDDDNEGGTPAHRRGVAPARSLRGAHELRPLYLQTGLIPQANGSAYMEMGRLKISCAVYGPRQVRGRQYSGHADLNVEVRLAPYALPKRARPGKDVESSSASLSALVSQALLPSIRLDLLVPKATLDIFVTVLEADALDEGCAAASATLASTALADAGVDLYGLVVGSTAAVYPHFPGSSSDSGQQSTIYLDPTRAEANAAQANVTLCSMPALGTVTALTQAGNPLTWTQTERALDLLHQSAGRIHYVVAQAISERFLARQRQQQQQHGLVEQEGPSAEDEETEQPFHLQ
ncbi:hypothetical protein V8E36_000644 [Tilletia maclaganii]